MRPVEFISMEQDHHASVYLINCIWEFFVLVCEQARDNRQAIRLALDTAMVNWLIFAPIYSRYLTEHLFAEFIQSGCFYETTCTYCSRARFTFTNTPRSSLKYPGFRRSMAGTSTQVTAVLGIYIYISP